MPKKITARQALAFLEREFPNPDRDDAKIEKVLGALRTVGERLSPRNRAKYFEFSGDFHRDRENYDDAVAAYEKLIAAEEAANESAVGLAHSWSRLAGAQVGAEAFDAAHASVLKAVALLENGGKPSDYDSIWFGYGHKLWQAGRYQTAVSALEEAVRWAERAGEPAKAMTGMLYFFINSLGQIAALQSVARAFAEITDEAEAAGISVGEALTPEIEEAAGSLAGTLAAAEEAMQKAEGYFREAPDDSLYFKTLCDIVEILHAGKKSAGVATLGQRFRELFESLGAEKENHQGPIKALAEAHEALGNESEAGHFRALVIEEEAAAVEEEAVTEESAPNVDFPFNWDAVDFESPALELIDLDFSAASYDYLEEYQVDTGTWFVCAFARDGIRNLYGFLLRPGKNFAECPITCIPENEAAVATYCSSAQNFIPRRIRTYLYARWDEFSALGDDGWKNLAALHHGLGGAGDLEYFREFLKRPENKGALLEKTTLVEKIEPGFPRELAYIFDDELVEPGFENPFAGAYGVRMANTYLERSGDAGGPLALEAAKVILSGYYPLDASITALELAVKLAAERDLFGGEDAPLQKAIHAWHRDFNGYSGLEHFDAALAALQSGKTLAAFSYLTFACAMAQNEGDFHGEYLAAAQKLAELSGWRDGHAALGYMRSLVKKDALTEDALSAIAAYERQVAAAIQDLQKVEGALVRKGLVEAAG